MIAEIDNHAGPKRCESWTSEEELRWERLTAQIEELRELTNFMDPGNAGGVARVIDRARESIDKARKARDQGNCQVAWRHCHQAYRFLLEEMSDEQRESRRRALRREAEEKLANWRRDAVLDIIGRDVNSEKIKAAQLTTAQFIMDEHSSNMYFKLEAAAIGLRFVPWIMSTLTAILIALAVYFHFYPQEPTLESTFILFDLSSVLIVVAAGAVGATLSNTLTMLGHAGRIPELLGRLRIWAVRLPLGALSAFAVVAVVQSKLLPLEGVKAPAIYAWAVAAGFSDQLLNQVMRRVEKAAER